MVNILRNKQLDQSQGQAPADISKVEIGAKAALAAASAAQQQTKQEKKQKKQQQQQAKPQEKNLVEKREEETRQIIGLSGGSITGAQKKTNQQMQQASTSEVVDAWTDPTKVREEDDLETALEKRLQRAETDAEAERISGDEPVIVSLEEATGLNEVGSAVRGHANYGVVEMSPELFLVLGGLSDSFDTLLASRGVDVIDPASLSSDELQSIFAILQGRKRKDLSEEEKEAELILAGAVTILAIPKILEKLDELGIDPEQVVSLRGTLAELVAEAQKQGSEYNSLYLLIKDETEYSKVPDDAGASP